MDPDRLRRLVGPLQQLIALGAASPARDSGCFLRPFICISNVLMRRCLALAQAYLEPPPDWRDSEEGVAWADALDALDVAVAERRGLDALNALHRAEALVSTVPPVEDRLTCVFSNWVSSIRLNHSMPLAGGDVWRALNAMHGSDE